MQAVVLAGGLGTRMRPRTEKVPKVLLEVNGRAFVDLLTARLEEAGYREVIFCIGHLGSMVRAHLGESRGAVRVRYVEDGPVLRGTAGALRAAYGEGLLAPTFLVTYGDSWLPFDYAAPLRALDMHRDCDGVMSVYRNDNRWDASNASVDRDGAWVLAYEKGATAPELDHIDYGALALRRDVVSRIPSDEPYDLALVQTRLARSRRLRALVTRERFFEIGSPEGLAALEHHLATAGR